MLATLTRLRALLFAGSIVVFATASASLEPADPALAGGLSPPVPLAVGSIFAVKRAAAHPSVAPAAVVSDDVPSVEAGPDELPPPAVAAPTLVATLDPVGVPLPLPPIDEASVVEAPIPEEALDEVRWTVGRRMRLDEVATNWGMWVADLRELNPEIGRSEWVEANTSFVVHRRDRRKPTRSVGAPNRGHLLSGIPMPEGDHWRLREHRPRAYGSRTTIAALLEALHAYGAADPDAPPLRIGEISRRNGGRIAPHVSHRSGRDVDIGYVMKSNPDENERFWRMATGKNIDAPRTWAMISALIATGKVQQIFISAKLQPIIAREAAKTLAPEDVALVFSAMNPDPSVHTIVKHETGHRDHMHVRFVCEPGNLRCRTQSADPH